MKTNNTHNNAHLITANGETRGVLYFTLHNGLMSSQVGYFQMAQDNKTIICRKINGRNKFAFVMIDQVLDFEPNETVRP
jgi:hypothetical protein